MDGRELLRQDLKDALSGKKLHEMHDWVGRLSTGATVYQDNIREWAAWLQRVLPAHKD